MGAGRTARIVVVATLVATGLVGTAMPTAAKAPPEDDPTLFVLRGEASVASGDLTIHDKKTEWLTDRPARDAGFLTPKQLDQGWDRWGFDDDPPNAAITGDGVDVVVELTNPRVRDGALQFDTEPVRGKLPSGDLGDVSVFVDPTAPVQTYQLQVVNNSNQQQSFYVYQQAGNGQQPLAWLATFAQPQTTTTFTWDTAYQLSWGEPGSLFVGQTYRSVQEVPAQIGEEVTLTQLAAGFQLTNQRPGSVRNALSVQCDATVTSNGAAVALGMSGAPAIAMSAQPNVNLVFPSGPPKFFLAASPFVTQGQVIDPNEAQGVALSFTQTRSLTATYNADNTLTISQT
jgi:hypothetical protein